MATLRAFGAALLLLASSATAHFTLDYPPTIGFDENQEASGPCGGFTADGKSTVTDFHVGGDNVAMNLLHPQGTWLFRATTDMTGASGWVALMPQVLQSGLGKFCEPMIAVNSSWAGKKGLVNSIVNAPDGVLYQCAAVNFVAGMASSNQPACTNSSGVQFSFTSDPGLATIAPSATGAAPTDSNTPAPTKSPNAAPGLAVLGGSLQLGNALVVVAMGLMGAAFML